MAFSEMHDEEGAVRECYAEVKRWIDETGIDGLHRRLEEAEAIFRRIGITFAVYTDGGDPERLIPFDLLPRVFSRLEWERLDKGIRQRAQALNAFLYDAYHRGEIMRAGLIPQELVYQNQAFRPRCDDQDP